MVYPLGDEFSVVVTGFDVNRDLFLQARNSPETDRILKPVARPHLHNAPA